MVKNFKSNEIQHIFESNPELYDKAYIVYAEDGYDFQEYVYEDGRRVPQGTPIGYETEDGKLILADDVYYSND